MCLGAHCVLGYIFSLLVFSGHHFQRMINNLYPIKYRHKLYQTCVHVFSAYCSLAYTSAVVSQPSKCLKFMTFRDLFLI